MMMRKKVYTIKEFLSQEETQDTSVREKIIVGVVALAVFITPELVFAAQPEGKISSAFDTKIWPLMLDLGKPLAKSMMAIGLYRCIRNDVDKGWKQFYRAGIGLAGLYLIDGAIDIVSGVGQDLRST